MPALNWHPRTNWLPGSLPNRGRRRSANIGSAAKSYFTPPPPTRNSSFETQRNGLFPAVAPVVPAPVVRVVPVGVMRARVPALPAPAVPPAGRVGRMDHQHADHEKRRQGAEDEFHGVTFVTEIEM